MYCHSTKNIIRTLIAAVLLFTGFCSSAYAALPEHIAVLPIEGEGKPEDLKELRVTFFNHIGSKNYRDMELEDIDSKLFLIEQQTGKNWKELTQKELADSLGVQGLMFLNVVGIEKIYAGVYGSLTVTLEVTFVDAETGKIIWKKEESVVRQSGSIPLSPWAAISTAVSSALVLRDSVKIELFDKLCRNIAKELPEPDSLAAVRPPTIFSVVTNTLDSPFKANEEILVSLKGDEGLKAYFNIIGQSDAVPLNEMKPGLYLGKIVVTEGTNYKGQLMEVFLVNTDTRKVSKYQVPYLVTVDTTPPGQPKDFKTNLSEKGFKLSWEKPDDDDVKEYVIKKAVVGQSEYQDLSTTEVNEFLDSDVEFGQKYFYRVLAKDLADNLSRPSEISRVGVKPGPTDVTGELKEDTVFYSYGSPYIVRGELTVPKGIKLTVEAGTVIRFEDGASLTVAGSIESQGTKESGVTFKGKEYNILLADTGAGGGVFTYTFLRNGGLFEVRNSDVSFENCRFESFEIGAKSTQNSSVKLINTVFGYNKTALYADSGFVTIDGCEFLHNGEALSFMSDVKSEIGYFAANDNSIDITTESPLKIKKAKIEGKESFEIIRSFRGPVDIEYVEPFRKSLKALITDSGSDLIAKTADALIGESFEDALKYIELLKELFPDRYSSIAPVEGFLRFRTGDQKSAKKLIESSDAPYIQKLSGALGLSDYSGPAEKIKFVNIKIPVFGTGEGIGKIAQSKAVKQAVKDHVSSVTGKLPRKKSFIVKDKILSDTEKYSSGSFPLYTKVSGAKFEGFYLVFLQTELILADLQDNRIIGNKKRELKVALASCGDGDNIRPDLSKELDSMLFPLSELPSKGCSFAEYKDDLKNSRADLLVIVKEEANSSQSRVSQNLKMINADMNIIVYDAKSANQMVEASKGVVVYHMNESMGKKAAMKKAFRAVKQDVLDKIVEIERARAPKTAPVEVASKNASKKSTKKVSKAKSPSQAKKAVTNPDAEDVVLTVAGVEPVFANMPEEYSKKPFITLVIANNSSENIRKSVVRLDVPGYFKAPLEAELESVPANDKVRLQLYAEFGDALKKTDRTRRTEAVVSMTYGKKKTETKYPVVIFDTRTTRWNTGDKLAIYIDSEDPVVQNIAEGVKDESARLTTDKELRKIVLGLVAADYLGGTGIEYRPDAKRPFIEVFGSNVKVDSVKYPSETISLKNGDADDLLALYGSVLKALGVDMAFSVSGEKVVALVDTSIPEELVEKIGFRKNQVVIYDENIWLPIDITKLKSGAEAAWVSGAQIAEGFGEETRMTLLSKALKSYKPANLFRQNAKVVPVETFRPKYEELKKLIVRK